MSRRPLSRVERSRPAHAGSSRIRSAWPTKSRQTRTGRARSEQELGLATPSTRGGSPSAKLGHHRRGSTGLFRTRIFLVSIAAIVSANFRGTTHALERGSDVATPNGDDTLPPQDRRESTAEELEALRARVLELESRVASARNQTIDGPERSSKAVPTPSGPSTGAAAGPPGAALPPASEGTKPPDVPALMALVDARDGSGLADAFVRAVQTGEAGLDVLREFALRADLEDPKLKRLVTEPQLSLAVLRVATVYPDELARLAEQLLAATSDRPASPLRRALFDLLPTFVEFHTRLARRSLEKLPEESAAEPYPSLRRALHAQIDAQLRSGAELFDILRTAMSDLAYEVPLDALAAALTKPVRKQIRGPIVETLAARGTAGVDAIVRWVDGTSDLSDAALPIALYSIAEDDVRSSTDRLRQFIEHPEPIIRLQSTLAYFRFERTDDDILLAFAFLNADVSPQLKRSLVQLLYQRSRELLETIHRQSDDLRDKNVRPMIDRLVKTPPSRSAGTDRRPAAESPRASNPPRSKKNEDANDER
jgi:hypothetical protein